MSAASNTLLVDCDLHMFEGEYIREFEDKSYTIGAGLIGKGTKMVDASMCMVIAVYDNCSPKYMHDSFGVRSPWELFQLLDSRGCKFQQGKMQEREQLESIAGIMCAEIKVIHKKYIVTITPAEINTKITLIMDDKHYHNDGNS